MEDLFALFDLDPLGKCLCGYCVCEIGHLFAVHTDAALRDESACLALARGKLARNQKLDDADLAVDDQLRTDGASLRRLSCRS